MAELSRTFLLDQGIGNMRDRIGWHREGQPELHAGIQISDVNQLTLELNSTPDRLGDYFTPSEIAYCQRRMPSLAARLAGKRAVIEILGETVPWQDIAIEQAGSERPQILLGDQALSLAKERGISSFPISLAHDEDEDLAVAFVLGVNDSSSQLQLGTDIASVEHFKLIKERKHGNRFLGRVYSEEEIHEAGGDAVKLAEKWAGKEAVAKALGTGVWKEGVALQDIRILTGDDGLPYVQLEGAALEQARKIGLQTWMIRIIKHLQTPLAFVIGTS